MRFLTLLFRSPSRLCQKVFSDPVKNDTKQKVRNTVLKLLIDQLINIKV